MVSVHPQRRIEGKAIPDHFGREFAPILSYKIGPGQAYPTKNKGLAHTVFCLYNRDMTTQTNLRSEHSANLALADRTIPAWQRPAPVRERKPEVSGKMMLWAAIASVPLSLAVVYVISKGI